MARKRNRSAAFPEADDPREALPAGTVSPEHLQASAPAAGAITEKEDVNMQNSIEQGRSIDYTPGADVTGGDLIVFPGMVAVASTDISAGETGACETEGVFALPKDATALAQGQAVYAKTDGTVTATESGNVPAGKCWADAAGNAATVAVKINA